MKLSRQCCVEPICGPKWLSQISQRSWNWTSWVCSWETTVLCIEDLLVALGEFQSRGLISLQQFFLPLNPETWTFFILLNNESKFTFRDYMVLRPLGLLLGAFWLVLTNWMWLSCLSWGSGGVAVTAFRHHDWLRQTWNTFYSSLARKLTETVWSPL